MRSPLAHTYEYLVTLPDRSYPFACEVEGRWVRGRRSYEAAVARAIDAYGMGRLGFKLELYRQTFHFLGSIIFIAFATILSERLFGSEVALYILFLAAIAALSFQEFYLHPRQYGQQTTKGVIDWLTWVTPIVVVVLFRQ